MSAKFDLKGRKMLLTGATRGIGLMLTRDLAGRGATVLAVARDADGLERLRQSERAVAGIRAVDLASNGTALAVRDWVTSEHPDCSVLINNAAIMLHDDLTEGASRHMDHIAVEIATNLTAPLQLSVAMLPLLARNGPAAILNVTSGLAIAPKRRAAVYCTTKAGLRSFTRSLRDQCRHQGLPVQVSEVVMTLVDTTLTKAEARRKYPPESAARDLLDGLERGLDEIWIEKTRLLRMVHRLSPALAYRIMRDT
ncbi:SDR family oxidoreductase [Paracoccus sp. SCSIO 75233]|uniref:SDR family oxidoreductase n=1 Tax=Paracoccus sp. SCSIO 75233 TaxID=3017782 RepID=UPI0022F0C345|nr:SDR family NAD(P)-dependent oxidoreductase [Paracoccus sp. SCSIO 75233]WBU53028.1 SDR family NAD(P)-dependent oxidoreductase [Paracoccus sp. SCSIO 75233]